MGLVGFFCAAIAMACSTPARTKDFGIDLYASEQNTGSA